MPIRVLKRFFEEEEGQNLVEYGLLVSLLALISIIGLRVLGTVMKNTFNKTADSLNTSSN